MFHGMTGFGRGSHEGCRVEITTVNRRHLEVQLLLPPPLQLLLVEIRSWIMARLGRGHIKVTISYDPATPAAMELDEARVVQLSSLADRLAEVAGISKEGALSLLLDRSEVIRHGEEEPMEAEQVRPAVEAALDGVVAMRRREGEAIGAELLARCKVLKEGIQAIEELAPAVIERHRAHLQEIIGKESTEHLLLVASRIDIAEEISRFGLHLAQLQECSSGKRADFLLQELLRESNTLGAKANDGEISRHVVRIKEELERLREQMQNVE